MENKHNQSLLNFAESVGRFIEYWGFKKVHGRIWALTFLNPTPVDASYLKKTLGISKALTSMSIKELLEYDVLLELKKNRPETQKYQANPEITDVIINVLKNRELNLLKEVSQNFQKVKKTSNQHGNICPSAINDMENMIETAHSILTAMVSLDQVDFKDIDQSLNSTRT